MRIVIFAIGVIGLLFLSIFSLTNYNHYYPSIKNFNDNPEKYEGITTEQHGVIKEINKNEFIFSIGNQDILVKSDFEIRKPKQGSVDIIGVFRKEGFIELKDIHYFDYNNSKYLTSVIGLIIFLFIFFKEWKLTFRGFKHARLD